MARPEPSPVRAKSPRRTAASSRRGPASAAHRCPLRTSPQWPPPPPRSLTKRLPAKTPLQHMRSLPPRPHQMAARRSLRPPLAPAPPATMQRLMPPPPQTRQWLPRQMRWGTPRRPRCPTACRLSRPQSRCRPRRRSPYSRASLTCPARCVLCSCSVLVPPLLQTQAQIAVLSGQPYLSSKVCGRMLALFRAVLHISFVFVADPVANGQATVPLQQGLLVWFCSRLVLVVLSVAKLS